VCVECGKCSEYIFAVGREAGRKRLSGVKLEGGIKSPVWGTCTGKIGMRNTIFVG